MMFSPPPAAGRPSFSLLERSSSSRSRSDQTHTPGSSAKGSMSKAKAGTRNVKYCSDAGFTLKGGKKHHAFDERDAPYPISYDPMMMDVDALDHIFLTGARKNITWVDFKDRPPTRSLDLGCGNGVWVVEAAKAWKECQFVGFDLVRIQPKLNLLPRDVASRIQWVQGNFLTGKLPFDDDSFDHVHIYRIAWGISEIKWDSLFEEVCRVLRPGGAIEMGEEDILFPALPRPCPSETKRPRSATQYPRPSLTLSPPPSPLEDQPGPTHAHAVLQSLFFGVFESRMINLRPTSIIPHHLNIYFRNVIATNRIEIPFPPPPIPRQQLRHCPSDSTARPMQRQKNRSESSVSTFDSIREGDKQQQTPPTTNSSLTSLSDTGQPPQPDPSRKPSQPFQVMEVFSGPEDPCIPMLNPTPLALNDHQLALNLNTMYRRILSCKEAMWGELRRRLLLRRTSGQDLLQGLGWDNQTGNEGESSDSGHGNGDTIGWGGEARELDRARTQFDELIVRFERDMRYRTAIGDALQGGLNWAKPAPSPMSKHERAREVELEDAMAASALAEAASRLTDDDQAMQSSRSFKCFVGFKVGKR